jgi:hypothetical protein
MTPRFAVKIHCQKIHNHIGSGQGSMLFYVLALRLTWTENMPAKTETDLADFRAEAQASPAASNTFPREE